MVYFLSSWCRSTIALERSLVKSAHPLSQVPSFPLSLVQAISGGQPCNKSTTHLRLQPSAHCMSCFSNCLAMDFYLSHFTQSNLVCFNNTFISLQQRLGRLRIWRLMMLAAVGLVLSIFPWFQRMLVTMTVLVRHSIKCWL